jgi:Tol biopolymer transport system component
VRSESPPNQPAGHGLRRVLAVVLAAVLLGIGVGVVIALRHKRTVPGPAPTTSAPPSTLPSSPATSPTPSPTPVLPQSAEPLGDDVIVWPRMHGGNWDVALLDLATGNQTRLTAGATVDWGPVISKDRRTIMYTRIIGGRPTTRVMAANGKGDRPLFDRPPKGCFRLSRPAAAKGGQLVVTCNTENAPRTVRLLVITLEGQIVRQLDKGRIGDPTVTPDGRSVLYWRNAQGDREGGALYRIPLDGSGPRVQLTKGGNGEDADPVVSPDGRRVAFSRGTATSRVVMTAPFNGKALTEAPRKRTDRQNDQDPSWSPDGLRIAYKSGAAEDGDLYVLDLASGKSKRVVENPEQDTVPAWTPR